jgi:hypothetical protein
MLVKIKPYQRLLNITILRSIGSSIGEVLEKGQLKSIRNWLKCMRNLMKVQEAKGVCKDRSK